MWNTRVDLGKSGGGGKVGGRHGGPSNEPVGYGSPQRKTKQNWGDTNELTVRGVTRHISTGNNMGGTLLGTKHILHGRNNVRINPRTKKAGKPERLGGLRIQQVGAISNARGEVQRAQQKKENNKHKTQTKKNKTPLGMCSGGQKRNDG